QHHILAENTNSERQILQFRRHRHGLPEAAKVLTTRGIRADVSQLGVFSGHMTTVIATVGLSHRLLLLTLHFHVSRRTANPPPLSQAFTRTGSPPCRRLPYNRPYCD